MSHHRSGCVKNLSLFAASTDWVRSDLSRAQYGGLTDVTLSRFFVFSGFFVTFLLLIVNFLFGQFLCPRAVVARLPIRLIFRAVVLNRGWGYDYRPLLLGAYICTSNYQHHLRPHNDRPNNLCRFVRTVTDYSK